MDKPTPTTDKGTIVEAALALATSLQEQIQASISKEEQDFHAKMSKLLEDPKNKVMLIELLDKSFRTQNKGKNFEFIEHILGKYGIADFFTPFEKVLLFMFLNFGRVAPSISVPFFVNHIRDDTKSMVLDSAPSTLRPHIEKRRGQNITLNINLIGEEVLGEAESRYRMDKYTEAIKSDYISYISIKITTIFSQINIIDFEWSREEVVKRLDTLYALASEVEKATGVAKFINLDMEEFRDLELTVAAFMESIAKFDIKAGIVLQAYLPDSYTYLKKLFAFSKARVLSGKPPIKIRFVKGANMEAEETIASQRDFALPTFRRKVDTDSNYFRMLDFILSEDNFKYINIGIASHNIFLIAYAYVRIQRAGAQECFTFEMLEGMSMQASFILSQMQDLILYAPVCDSAHFNNAIAYLVRRLDENTSEDNFMRYFFNLKVGDKNWEAQKQLFLDAIAGEDTLQTSSYRTQDRTKRVAAKSSLEGFVNEADTDFIMENNREWAKGIVARYKDLAKQNIYPSIYKEGDNLSMLSSLTLRDKIYGKEIGSVALADEAGIKKALSVAKNSSFKDLSFKEVHIILARVAALLRERRADLLGIAALEVGKTFLELDPEISEAIDFLEFYPHSIEKLQKDHANTSFAPLGVVASIAPWNFPIGISVGCIAAPLAARNAVIYKPSSIAPLTGHMICELFYEAGVPRDALIYLPSSGSDISKYLLSDSSIGAAILTGGEDTAYEMLKMNPTLTLSAETGGKNATIVTRLADRDAAIKNIVHSAFSNSGQKCSATSLLVLEREVYEDASFRATLVDAASSLEIGSPFVLKNKLSALAQPLSPKLKRAISELEDGESWALRPAFVEVNGRENEHLMTPGIKYGATKDSYTFKTELFAPLLTVVCAESLEQAVSLVNSTGYGLTAGLESLDEREWEYFRDNIEAGNLYINKPTTGAIVLRQPFGGVKKSAIGFGRKVGIYNYVTQFMDIRQEAAEELELGSFTPIEKIICDLQASITLASSEQDMLKTACCMARSYSYYKASEFDVEKEYVHIRGEDNLFGYTRVDSIGYRISDEDTLENILGVVIAAATLKIPLYMSASKEAKLEVTTKIVDEIKSKLQASISLVREDSEGFASKVAQFARVRYLAPKNADDPIYLAASAHAKIIASKPPLSNGRFELLYYHNERSTSISFHRYGNLGARALVQND